MLSAAKDNYLQLPKSSLSMGMGTGLAVTQDLSSLLEEKKQL